MVNTLWKVLSHILASALLPILPMVPTHRDRFRGALSGYFLGQLCSELWQSQLHRSIASPPSCPSIPAEQRLAQQLHQLQKYTQLAITQLAQSYPPHPAITVTQDQASSTNVQSLVLRTLPQLLLHSHGTVPPKLPWRSPPSTEPNPIEPSKQLAENKGHQVEQLLCDRLTTILERSSPPTKAPKRLEKSHPLLPDFSPSGLDTLIIKAECCFVSSPHHLQLAQGHWHQYIQHNKASQILSSCSLCPPREQLLNDINNSGAQLIGIWFGTAHGHQAFPLELKQRLGSLYPSLLTLADHLYTAWTGQTDLQEVSVSYGEGLPVSTPIV